MQALSSARTSFTVVANKPSASRVARRAVTVKAQMNVNKYVSTTENTVVHTEWPADAATVANWTHIRDGNARQHGPNSRPPRPFWPPPASILVPMADMMPSIAPSPRTMPYRRGSADRFCSARPRTDVAPTARSHRRRSHCPLPLPARTPAHSPSASRDAPGTSSRPPSRSSRTPSWPWEPLPTPERFSTST